MSWNSRVWCVVLRAWNGDVCGSLTPLRDPSPLHANFDDKEGYTRRPTSGGQLRLRRFENGRPWRGVVWCVVWGVWCVVCVVGWWGAVVGWWRGGVVWWCGGVVVLCCAVLCCAVLCCAVLCCAVLCCAVLCCAVLCCGVVWCGVVWCGVVWCGVVWCAVLWCGVVWCGVVWCGVVWCGVWCGVVWCGVVWCGVVWCGVVWCGVVWCGVVWWWCGPVCNDACLSMTTHKMHLIMGAVSPVDTTPGPAPVCRALKTQPPHLSEHSARCMATSKTSCDMPLPSS